MRLKEKIIIAFIIISTIALALVPVIRGSGSFNDTSPIDDKICIAIEGEINALGKDGDITNKMQIYVKSGSSYGYIISRIRIYLTRYSVLDSDMKQRYFIDSRIIIKSSNKDIDKNTIGKGKISINRASYSELLRIEGIKSSRAKKIISYRRNKRIESYTELKGILDLSDAAIEDIKKQAFL